MRKRLLLYFSWLIFLGVGFFLHAIFFPDLFSNGIFFKPKVDIATQQNNNSQTITSEYKVYFDGSKFSRSSIVVPFTRYLVILNDDPNNKMDLISNLPSLNTGRPFGYLEQLRLRMDKKGTFVVQVNGNPAEQLTIVVK